MLLFYSRDLKQAPKLAEYCAENDIQLHAQSMISFEEVDFKMPDKNMDVVFFTSPRSVDFFLQKAEVLKHQKVACIGTQTKNHLENLGLKVSFYGVNSTEPDEVAQTFLLWLGNQTVLFPVSDQSNRSITKVLNTPQIEEIVVYKTLEKPQSFSEIPDVLIFSSPSNASAYLKANTIGSNQKVACFGRTTFNFLNNNKIAAHILSAPTEEAVLAFLEISYHN